MLDANALATSPAGEALIAGVTVRRSCAQRAGLDVLSDGDREHLATPGVDQIVAAVRDDLR